MFTFLKEFPIFIPAWSQAFRLNAKKGYGKRCVVLHRAYQRYANREKLEGAYNRNAKFYKGLFKAILVCAGYLMLQLTHAHAEETAQESMSEGLSEDTKSCTSLIENSPFVPSHFKGSSNAVAEQGLGESEEYLLKGIVAMGKGHCLFSITNRITDKGVLLSSNPAENSGNLSVRYYGYDKDNKTLVLETYEGLRRIPLAKSAYVNNKSVPGASNSYGGGDSDIDFDDMDEEDESEDELFSAASQEMDKVPEGEKSTDDDVLEKYRQRLEALKDKPTDS